MSRGATLASSVFALLVVLFVGASEARAICCGATCCSIDGACRATGAVNPANSCEECRPSGSGGQTDWTPIAGCTPAVDAGRPMGTDAGTTTPPRASGGCSASGHTSAAAPLSILAVALGLVAVRRRR